MAKKLLIDGICCLLAALFMYTAVNKLLDYAEFQLQLHRSPFIFSHADTVAMTLPAIEILIAVCLVFKHTRLYGLYCSLFLMTMFTAYIYSMLRYSFYIPCSCGGFLSLLSWTDHLWFNSVFIVLSIIGILCMVGRNTVNAKHAIPLTKLEVQCGNI